jgi:hypothetical protein
MRPIAHFPRRFAPAAAGLALMGGTSLFVGTAGSAAGVQVGLQPNHRISSKPPGGGHGGGGGGSSSFPGWASSNWSGYAITSPAPFTGITGTWTVPSVSATSSSTYSAAWAGIDGFNNNSLIQTGTEQDYYSGSAHYSAWWTTSAQSFIEQPISGTVLPGDPITATITETPGSSTWTIKLVDSAAGNGWTFTKSVVYTGPGASAEWIMEAPTVGGRIAPLAHYSSPTAFDPGTVDGSLNPGLVASNGGELIQGSRRFSQVVSIPSGPDNDTDGFNISYGATAPSPPSS